MPRISDTLTVEDLEKKLEERYCEITRLSDEGQHLRIAVDRYAEDAAHAQEAMKGLVREFFAQKETLKRHPCD